VLHGFVAAFGNDDGLGEAVLGAAAVGVDEELDEAEAKFEGGGSVAEGSLDRVPEGEVGVDDGDDADTEERFAEGASFAEPGEDAEVEDGDEEFGEDADTLVVDVLVEGGVVGFDVELVEAERNLEVAEMVSLVFEEFGVGHCTEEDAEQEHGGDEGGVEGEGEGAAPERGEFDAVEREEPLGFAGGEVAHAESVMAVCYPEADS